MSDTPEPQTQEQRAHEFIAAFQSLRAEVRKVIVGHDDVITHVLIGLFAGGHVLLEGVPGLGETLLIKTLAESLDLTFSRIQFTPDLMPGDIIGTNIIVEDASGRKQFQFQRGPIFGHILLADEVNRATPKTQSALLEGMQEGAVTVSGTPNPLPSPFFVLATQNPIEMEGTYPLPEAQLDRFFFKLRVAYPSEAAMHDIIERTTATTSTPVNRIVDGTEILEMRQISRAVPIAKPIQSYAIRLTLASHPDSPYASPLVKRYVRFGASPRAAQALVLAGKIHALRRGNAFVAVEDIRAVALPALRHRVLLNFEGEAEQVNPDNIVNELLTTVSAEGH
jgi:MoxR-like ATPase